MALHRSRSVRASESVSRRSPRWRRGAALSHAGAYVGPYRTAYTRQAGSPPGSPRRADRRLGARFLAMAFRSDVWFLPIARDIEADLMWVPLSFSQHGRRAQIPIALLPHQSPPAALVHYLPTRFRALALFGRRLPERVVRSSLPASENLHKTGHAPVAKSPLFNHRVGAREQRWRNFEAECLGGRQIDDKIEFGRLLDRNVARLRPA
jgi:hypothetical protein